MNCKKQYIIFSKISNTKAYDEIFDSKKCAQLVLSDLKLGIKLRNGKNSHLIVKKYNGKEKLITEKQYIKETNYK